MLINNNNSWKLVIHKNSVLVEWGSDNFRDIWPRAAGCHFRLISDNLDSTHNQKNFGMVAWVMVDHDAGRCS